MADTTFTVLDSASTTVTFRAQAVVGTTLVMMSVPSNTAGTSLLGQAVMATSIPVAIASNQSPVPITGAGGTSTVTLGGGTATITLAGGTSTLGGGTTSVNLIQVGGSTFGLGQAIMATSLPVAIASNQSTLPFNLVSFNGTAVTIGQQVVTASLPVALPSNQIVSTNLTQVGAVAFTLGQAIMATSIPVAIASNQSAIPVTGGGTSIVTLAGGTAILAGGTTSVNLNQVGGSTFALGQAVMGTSLPVAIASNQSNVPFNLSAVGGSTFSLGQKVSATSISVAFASDAVLTTTLSATTVLGVNIASVGGAAFALGQAVMGTSLPVAIASNQSNVPFNFAAVGGTAMVIGQRPSTGSLSFVLASDGVLTTVLSATTVLGVNIASVGGVAFSLGQAVMATSLPVAIASNQSAIPVTNAGGTATVTLAGGTATLAGGTATVTLGGGTASLGGGTTSVNLIQVGGSTFGLGQAIMATSLPVAISSNQSIIPIGGNIATGGANVGNPVKLGVVAYTTWPTAVANNTIMDLAGDKAGRVLAVGAPRAYLANQTASLTTAAEATIVNPVNATTFADIYGLVLANTGATTTKVDLRYGTGSTILITFEVPTLDTRGFMLPIDSAIPGSLSTANVSWTAQCAATTTLSVTAFYVKNI